MKKLTKFIAALAVILIPMNLFAQNQNHAVDLNNISKTQFPCWIVNNSAYDQPSVFFNNPTELSIYFSDKAQKKIRNAETLFITSAATTAVGGILYGIGQYNVSFTNRASNALSLVGVVFVCGGAICEIASIVDVLGHFKWDYRRKQVDLYLNPTGATLKF